ncbi:hypothetical protein DL771_001635 [Monosporascus sp. 5C6A]|nr:hypothetical protein DL771_001635 [Monosporascus sp. 5C6A]
MATSAPANALLGNIQKKPWQAPSAEEYLSKLRAIFVPHIVNRGSREVVNYDIMGRCTKEPSLRRSNEETPIESAWRRDEYLCTADRVRIVARCIKWLFHWHIDEPDKKFLPRLPFQGRPGTSIDEPIRETWASTP